MKFIVVTGGVLSGIGKGVATASIGRLMCEGKRVVTLKCDGYLNVDPGTMNPLEHGEVFVLQDGAEVDMDFGHYARFLGVQCKADWSITSGKIFTSITARERKGDFLGQTIQIYPHLPNEIKRWWFSVAEREAADVVLIEIGGTVGDIENSWFIEAARQLRKDVGPKNVAYVHLTYVPFLDSVGEQKTKPAQRDISLLREKGIIPDVILCRAKHPLVQKCREKIAMFGDVSSKQVLSCHDVSSIYELPLVLAKEGLPSLLNEQLSISGTLDLATWEKLVQRLHSPQKMITIAVCGKYTALHDSYASISEAFTHAGAKLGCGVRLKWIDAEAFEEGRIDMQSAFNEVQGVLVPGGFGSRGVEGKIRMIQHCRATGLPFLGICYGLQLAVVEFARNVCGLTSSHTTEVDSSTPHPVITLLESQNGIMNKGATMRLGAYTAELLQGSIVQQLYESNSATERHRHRFEVNPAYHGVLHEKGMVFSGLNSDGRLVEYIELKDHPFFVATQAHPELSSRLECPNPLFVGLLRAVLCSKPDEHKSDENEKNAANFEHGDILLEQQF